MMNINYYIVAIQCHFHKRLNSLSDAMCSKLQYTIGSAWHVYTRILEGHSHPKYITRMLNFSTLRTIKLSMLTCIHTHTKHNNTIELLSNYFDCYTFANECNKTQLDIHTKTIPTNLLFFIFFLHKLSNFFTTSTIKITHFSTMQSYRF